MINIEIDTARCDNCNLCLAACRHGGLSVVEGRIVVDDLTDCGDCRTCEFICERGAIRWNYRVVLAESATE
jgi:NAD-dependent dihydropyrimidine dehydrogenase PreA subunit